MAPEDRERLLALAQLGPELSDGPLPVNFRQFGQGGTSMQRGRRGPHGRIHRAGSRAPLARLVYPRYRNMVKTCSVWTLV